MTSFLQRVADSLLERHDALTQIQVVLPSRRSAIFLRQALAQRSDAPRWAPDITTISDMVYAWSGWQKADPVSLLFWAYEAYEEVFQASADSFDNFVRWAPVMLSDFSEIDVQRVPADELLGYLADAKRIEHWEPQAGYNSDTVQQYMQMWAAMPAVYHKLREKLAQHKMVYQGMAYRKAVELLPEILPQLSEKYEKMYFIGFNVLTRAEQTIFSYLYQERKAHFYWDMDTWYWNQKDHEASAGLRQIKLVQGLREKDQFHFCENYIESHPIAVHEVPASGNHAQIMAVQKILEQIPEEELHNSAVILADEALLLPFLENLTPHVANLNVTMGLPLAMHPLAGFFSHLLQGRLEAEKQQSITAHQSMAYHTRWWEQLFSFKETALMLGADTTETLCNSLKNQNKAWLSMAQIEKLASLSGASVLISLLEKTFTPAAFFNRMVDLAEALRPLSTNAVHREALYHFYTLFNRLQQLLQARDSRVGFDTLQNFYRQALAGETLDLIGEPLQGLQVMGILESRNIDFRHIIILSLNEGIFPQSGGRDSFIPFDIKRKYGLPTFLDKDATYAYYFYRYLHRSEHLWLVYNNEITPLQSGEASRYLLQVKKELAPTLSNVNYATYSLKGGDLLLKDQIREHSKTAAIMERLQQKAESGFSYSALSSYLQSPLKFYYQELIDLQEAEQWEPTITPRELGTTVHAVLEDMYRPFLGQRLTANEPFLHLKTKQIEDLLRQKYWELSGDRTFKEGHDVLKMEQMILMIRQFLSSEKKLLENTENELIIKGLEMEYSAELHLPKGQKVILKGLADRVDSLNGVTRIIDYKTGSASSQSYALSHYDNYRQPEKIKALQLMIYGYLYLRNHPDAGEVEAAVLSLQKNQQAYIPLKLIGNKLLKREDLAPIENELILILEDIFEVEKPFEEQLDLQDE